MSAAVAVASRPFSSACCFRVFTSASAAGIASASFRACAALSLFSFA